MVLKMGETSTSDVSVLEGAHLFGQTPVLVEPCPKEAPFEELCGDIVMGSATPGIGLIDPICIKPLYLTPTSSPSLPTTPSYVHAFHASLCDIRGYNPSFDPYCAYLEDVPRKIMWIPFFEHAFDISMAFDEFKKPLTLFAPSFLVFSYSHHSEMHGTTYDNLLGALTTTKWSDSSMDARSG